MLEIGLRSNTASKDSNTTKKDSNTARKDSKQRVIKSICRVGKNDTGMLNVFCSMSVRLDVCIFVF